MKAKKKSGQRGIFLWIGAAVLVALLIVLGLSVSRVVNLQDVLQRPQAVFEDPGATVGTPKACPLVHPQCGLLEYAKCVNGEYECTTLLPGLTGNPDPTKQTVNSGTQNTSSGETDQCEPGTNAGCFSNEKCRHKMGGYICVQNGCPEEMPACKTGEVAQCNDGKSWKCNATPGGTGSSGGATTTDSCPAEMPSCPTGQVAQCNDGKSWKCNTETSSGGGNSGGSGSGSGNGGSSSGGQASTATGCNPSSPAKVWSCFQNGVNGVGKGNCAYCLAQNGSGGSGTGGSGSCYTSCYSKTGNGSGCTYVCANNKSCWTACAAQGKSCLTSCLSGNGTPTTHLECKSGGEGVSVKVNDDDNQIKYSGPWTYADGGGGSTAAFKGDYHYAPGPLSSTTVKNNFNASASFVFTGSKVTIGALSWTNRGNIDVFIDGNKVDSVKTDSGGAVGPITWTSSALSCSQHTLKVSQSDTAGATGGRLIALDFVSYDSCGTASGPSCMVVNGSGSNQGGCTVSGEGCGSTPNTCTSDSNCGSGQVCDGGTCRLRGEVDACWGDLGTNGRCYDCNGDGTINILDFSCFAKHWLDTI